MSYKEILIIYDSANNCYELFKPNIKQYDLSNFTGPTIICSDGTLEYWINNEFIGINLSSKDFQQKIKEAIFK